MNKEEILNKYIDLIDKGYCSDCNELNCIDNFPHAKIAHSIRELQQENKKQKEENEFLKSENKKLKELIDKAIEYIENNSLYEEEYDYDYEENSYLSGIDDETAKKDLLKILRGETNE